MLSLIGGLVGSSKNRFYSLLPLKRTTSGPKDGGPALLQSIESFSSGDGRGATKTQLIQKLQKYEFSDLRSESLKFSNICEFS